MKIKTTLLRETALAVPLLVISGTLVGGTWGAFATAVCGLVALLNLGAMWFIVDRLVQATASGQGGGAAIGLLFGKMTLLLVVYAGLLALFEPIYVLLGLALVLSGLAVFGVVNGLRTEFAAEDV